MCARGYSNQFAGFASSSILMSVVLASIPVGLIASKIKKELQISKMLVSVSLLASSAFAYLVTVSGQGQMLITICIIMGVTSRYEKPFNCFYVTHKNYIFWYAGFLIRNLFHFL